MQVESISEQCRYMQITGYRRNFLRDLLHPHLYSSSISLLGMQLGIFTHEPMKSGSSPLPSVFRLVAAAAIRFFPEPRGRSRRFVRTSGVL